MTATASLTSAVDSLKRLVREADALTRASWLATSVAFALLFSRPATLLAGSWWNDPNNGHGLLLAPLSIWLAWRAGLTPNRRPQPVLGTAMVLLAVVARYASDLAAELFTMRGSMLLALAGLVVFYAGFRQLLRWWLPFVLLALCVPLPEVVLNSVALPLQFVASRIGASLLEWRHIPVLLAGNVIRIPGQELFVAEACSGLRSLTALLSLGVLIGALFLDRVVSRAVLLALTIPVAILINGVRVFLTGFLVLYVSPEMGEGFMHTSEGMVMFGGAMLVTGALAWILGAIERVFRSSPLEA